MKKDAIVFMGKSNAIIAWIGMAHRTDCTKVSLPLFGIRAALHFDSLLAI